MASPAIITLSNNAAAGRTAVSMGFLMSFAKRVPLEYSTADIVTKIVVPETRSHLCRYIDTLSEFDCAAPHYFISHRWASPFHHLVNALRRHFGDKNGDKVPADIYVWLDIFAVNQHPGQAQNDDLSKLQDVIQQADKTLLVMDNDGQVLRRVWCLFEIFKTVSYKGVAKLVVLAHDVNLMGLKDIFIKLDVAEAQATNEDDRQRILEDIRKTIGLDRLNNLIRTALVDSTRLEVSQLRQARDCDKHAYFSALNKAAQMLTLVGNYSEAESLMREALHLAYETVGERSTAVASCVNNLAEVLRYQGHFGEAEALQRQAVELSEQILGQDHPTTATYLGNMAQLEMALGRPAAAEPLLKRALDISTKANGPDAAETAVLLNSLASLLLDLGKVVEAEKYYRTALAVIEKRLGPDDPEQVAYIANLAGVLQEGERHEEAQALLEKALTLCTRTLGDQHPMTATVLNNLGEALARQKRIDEAEPLIRKALKIRQQTLGEEHPATANSLNNLGGLLMSQGNVEEAAATFQQSLHISRTVLGDHHPVVANRLNNLGSVLAEQGKLEEAESLMREALAARIKVLGEGHMDTAVSTNNLAGLLFQMGKLEEAIVMYKKVLEMQRGLIGDDHPATLSTLTSLAMAQHQLGCEAGSTLALLKEALVLAIKIHGAESEEVDQYNHFISMVEEGLTNEPPPALLNSPKSPRSPHTISPAGSLGLDAVLNLSTSPGHRSMTINAMPQVAQAAASDAKPTKEKKGKTPSGSRSPSVGRGLAARRSVTEAGSILADQLNAKLSVDRSASEAGHKQTSPKSRTANGRSSPPSPHTNSSSESLNARLSNGHSKPTQHVGFTVKASATATAATPSAKAAEAGALKKVNVPTSKSGGLSGLKSSKSGNLDVHKVAASPAQPNQKPAPGLAHAKALGSMPRIGK